jgi:SAM-dependent methyltransferase
MQNLCLAPATAFLMIGRMPAGPKGGSMDATGWDERYAGREYIRDIAPNRFVEAHLADLPPGTAIDLAAGEGRNAVWLATRGWHVTAVDFSRVGLQKAHRLASEHSVVDRVRTTLVDVLTYVPFELVDLVVVAYLQLPPEQRHTVLARAATWLRPGGTILIVAHDRSNVEHGHGGPSDPDHCYEVDATVAALGGLAISSAGIVERPVESDTGSSVAFDTLVIATRPVG